MALSRSAARAKQSLGADATNGRQNEALRGRVNLTAPEPVTNKELSRTLGPVLRRPSLAPVPALAVRALYGEMASIVHGAPRRADPAPRAWLRVSRPDLEQALQAATAT